MKWCIKRTDPILDPNVAYLSCKYWERKARRQDGLLGWKMKEKYKMKGITFEETLAMLMKMNKFGGNAGKARMALRKAFQGLAQSGSPKAINVLDKLGIKVRYKEHSKWEATHTAKLAAG